MLHRMSLLACQHNWRKVKKYDLKCNSPARARQSQTEQNKTVATVILTFVLSGPVKFMTTLNSCMELNQEKLDKGGPAPFWKPLLHPLSAVKATQ